MKQFICLLVAMSVLLSLCACNEKPQTETSAPTTAPSASVTETTQPPVDVLASYHDAIAALAAMKDVSMTVNITDTVRVGGESFTNQSTQNITYLGLNTEEFSASVTESIDYSAYDTKIEEIYTAGTAYATVYGSKFSSEMTAEEFTGRYLPIQLIDETLYASHAVEEKDGKTYITFAEPQALEQWLSTDATTLISAEATAVLDSNGAVHQYQYTATYRNAGGEISSTVSVLFTDLTVTSISAPTDADSYTKLSYLDGPRMLEQIYGYLLRGKSVTFGSATQIVSQAASCVAIENTTINTWGTGTSLLSAIDYNCEMVNYYTEENYEYKQTERFEGGKYTISTDGGKPEANRSIQASDVTEYILETISADVYDCSYFTEAVCTDLGDLLLIEFTGNEQLAKSLNEFINEYLFSDPAFLDDYSTAYHTDTMEYYIGVDKHLGLPTSIGIHFTGYHTIDGQEYMLDYQMDQSIYLASLSSYEYVTKHSSPDAEPENPATPLFYHVTGPDGQELWLLGTIHVGDDRTGHLPQKIYDAFDASDALAVECNTRTFDEQVEKDEALQSAVSNAYYYTDGTSAADHVKDEQLYETALKMMKATGNYFFNAPYMTMPVWAQCLDNYHLQQCYTLSSDKGVDNRLLMRAEDSGKTILEVESNLFQIQMLTGWSEDLSLLLLEESVSTDLASYLSGITELYEMWCSGDEATLTAYLNEEDLSDLTEEELKLYEEYNTAMSTDRDKDMIKKAISYLESGDTVFFAVGLAHVLAESGLVNGLREAGYTVELVTYE